LIFSFIQYTQPGWCFNLIPTVSEFSSCYYHPEWIQLPDNEQIELDNAYQTLAAQYMDAGYRAWNNGHLILCSQHQVQQFNTLPKPSLTDEYRFITKYWGKHWACLALGARLFKLHNPVKEVHAFVKGMNVSRFALYNQLKDRTAYHTFQSTLIKEQPLVSVIIPTLNRYEYLKDVLEDLEKQTWTNFDVIIVDQSNPYNANFYTQFNLRLQVIPQTEKLLWTARNNAVRKSKANFFLFFDDDSRVEPDWIEQHMKTLDFFKADISAGVSLSVIGAKIPKHYSFFRWADQFDSGNALVTRKVFQQIGMFDLQFNKERMGDGEFGIRAYLSGIKSISNPYAKRVHLKVPSGGLREIGHWDGFRPKKWFAPKPVPSVIYLYKKYFPKHLYLNSIYLGIMLSNLSFKSKRDNRLVLVSMLITIIKLPLLAIQFHKSLSLANKKLQKGSMAEQL
jgi:glycosyltransferase involved in cell wall biosynthesis